MRALLISDLSQTHSTGNSDQPETGDDDDDDEGDEEEDGGSEEDINSSELDGDKDGSCEMRKKKKGSSEKQVKIPGFYFCVYIMRS